MIHYRTVTASMSQYGLCLLGSKGAIIYYQEGGRLFVIAGRQFFLSPPLGLRKRILAPHLKEYPLT